MIMKNATLVHLLLFYMYDKSLLTPIEMNRLQKRYAVALELDSENVYSALESIISK
mgnify:FL=1